MKKERAGRILALAVVVALALLAASWSADAQESGLMISEPMDVLVTNVFFDTFIVDALSDLSMQTGIPILADTTVGGFVTVEFFDVPLPVALEQLLLPGGYTYKWMNGYYLVGSARRDSPLFHVLSVTERVELKNVRAEDVPAMLALPFRDLVRPDPATNSVIVTGDAAVVERILADIALIDVPPHQIVIDALITEVSEQGRKALGLDWTWTEEVPASQRVSRVGVQQLVGTIGYSLNGVDALLMQLRSVVERGDAKIRANPSLVALEGQPASMFVGRTTYYRIVTGSEQAPTTRLEAIQAGVSLNLLARVADDGTIVLQITPSVEDVQGFGTDDMPVVGTRRVQTTVRVKDGETIVIGELLQEREVETRSGIPLLGNLPILGRLFSNTRTTSEETEVLIFITPRILRDGE